MSKIITDFLTGCIVHDYTTTWLSMWVKLPDSILLRIDRAHFKKASSTFSPVRALVSRNINSAMMAQLL